MEALKHETIAIIINYRSIYKMKIYDFSFLNSKWNKLIKYIEMINLQEDNLEQVVECCI